MASPDVLKNFGRGRRSCADSPEQMNLVELMCEFVEAMNPGILLSKYVICSLISFKKDSRDIFFLENLKFSKTEI